ncbi:MAG: SprB repeat-containing protein [Flavobacteriales bacterium]|nr:SprB repeat-containing protein [Flavobacteriales bacterium]
MVTDSLNEVAEAEITLTEPTALRLAAAPFTYPNGLNLSCHECYNGSIDVTVTDGVPPYTYSWDDNATTADRSGLGALTYTLTVTDANGCQVNSERITLTSLSAATGAWMANTGTDPAQHYLGTRDSTDFVFKSNGQERLRLLGNGELKLTSPVLNTGVVYIDANGVMRGGGTGFPDEPPMPVEPCGEELQGLKYWNTGGNYFVYPQCDQDNMPVLGTHTPTPVSFITSGAERMRITPEGKVAIGTAPVGAIDGYRLYVEDGIATRDVLVKHGAWPDFVFASGYSLLPLDELRDFLQRHKHLPHVPSAAELDAQGGVALAEHASALTRTVEEQALYILQLEERLQRVEQRMVHLEASKP